MFPDQPKIARVTPLFKKSDNALMDNYRPISVRPCFSKMLERIICNRLYSFFYENITLCKKQFGFKKQDSTGHTMVHLVSKILNSLENNCYALSVFTDLTKAFDTVDHNILLKIFP